MKKFSFYIAIAGMSAGTSALPLHAQVYNQAPQNQGGDTTVINKNEKKSAESPFGNEIPVFDASSENIIIGETTYWNPSDQRVFAMRFESYLNSKPFDDPAVIEYYDTLKKLSALLTEGGFKERRENFPKALAMLAKASQFEQATNTANVSASLYNQIFQIWMVKRDSYEMSKTIAQLKKEQANIIWAADLRATARNLADQEGSSKRGGTNSSENGGESQATGEGTNSLDYISMVTDLGEKEIEEKALKVEIIKSETLAKTEYHVFMVQMFLQRRFEHCQIAARFYNHIFDDGAATLKIEENSDADKLFKDTLGGSPTVSTLDAAASEAMGDVYDKIKTVNLHLENKELWTAYQRLQEAFILGEYLMPIRLYPLEKKRQLYSFARMRYRLLSEINTKDYDEASKILDAMKAEAPDFNGAQEEAWIQGNMMQANMALKKAELLFFENKQEEADKQVHIAAEIWPSNKNLKTFLNKTDDLVGLAKLTNDYERLLAEKNHAQIFERRYDFGPVMSKDAAKRAEFEKILDDHTEVTKAIEFSKQAEASSTPFALIAAWEEIQILKDRFPTNTDLIIRSDALTKQVAEFANILEQAKRHERSSRTGSALAYYMKARSLYLDSKYASEGIERLLDQTLSDKNTHATIGGDDQSTKPVSTSSTAKDSPADPF